MNLYSRIRGVYIILLVCCLTLVMVWPATAETNPVVMMVDVQGNTQVPSSKILGVISKVRIGEPFDARQVEADMKAISDLGYFSDVSVKTDKMFNGLKVVFEVVENPNFKELIITGLTKVKPEEMQSFFSQKPGEVFNTVTFREELTKALKSFREKKGLFIEPRAEGKIGFSQEGVVQIELVENKYGKIIVRGLQKTKEFVFLRELSIKEGDIFDYNALREDFMKIMRLRLFDNVEPHFEKSTTVPDAYDVIFDVKEAQTGTFSFGVSFGQSDGEIGGVLGYSEANLMGLGQNLALDLNFTESEQNAQFSFYEPWLDKKHTSFGVSMWNSDNDFTTTMNKWNLGTPKDTQYDIHLVETGLSVSFGRPLWKDVTGQVQFGFKRNTIDELTTTVDGVNNTPNTTIEFWDNSAGLSLTKNKLSYQDRNFVDGGYWLSADYTNAGKFLGGEFDYQKATLEGKWFHAFNPNFVVGTRLQAAVIDGSYPDYNALYLGGMYKLRGYADRRYDDALTTQLIGSSYLLSNTELRYRMPSNKSLEFVLFYDAGQINNIGGGSSLKSDYGFGLRYNIPFLGVLRLDQAWNTGKNGDNRLVFSLGEMF